MLAVMTTADNHAHSQFSWDAPLGDMDATCARAVQLGLSSVAFTDHCDWVRGMEATVDVAAYFECVERCRAKYPSLRILSGLEMGEPHLYREEAAGLLRHPFDRVLASIHCIAWEGRLTDASERGFLTAENFVEVFRRYMESTVALLESDLPFQVLAHIDYAKRYRPEGVAYNDRDYEAEFRAALRAAARRDAVLEINTTRGGDPARYLSPGPNVIGWWREEGGRAVSFGSDTHSAKHLAAGFEYARDVAEGAGFRAQDDPLDFWVSPRHF
jgi:histidinol-phosphatase (PHP family)